MQKGLREMLVSPLPGWKQLLFPQSSKKENYWNGSIWLSRSGVSIRLLIAAFSKVSHKDIMYVWIPEFFCAETEEEFSDQYVKVVRYPITKDFEPDWDKAKQLLDKDNLDIFIFVHYFGEIHDISKARVFCDKNGAMLIEDCAHVLYKYGKIGQKGDFAIYSPHKILAIPDGAIIQCNSRSNEKYNEIYQEVQIMAGEPKSMPLKIGIWKIKKCVQKILRISRPAGYGYKVHYYEGKLKKEECLGISKWSYNAIQNLSYEDMKKIAYVRRENLSILTYLVQQAEPSVTPVISADAECPFFAVYSLEKVSRPEEAIRKIQALGINVMYWPSLSKDVEETGVAAACSKNIFVVPIHQGIAPQRLAKKIKMRQSVQEGQLCLEKVSGGPEDINRWNSVLAAAKLSNITQDWYYGDVKHQAENWSVDRIIILKDNKDVGAVQVLKKTFGGIAAAIRINQGPIFIEGENNIENELEAVSRLRRRYYFIPFFYVPFSIMNAENYSKIINEGWKNWNIFGFPTGSIDLTRTIDDIRASLDSKWRNQLKTSEKNEYAIYSDHSRFDEMMKYYESEQQEKGFVGVKTELLKCMNDLPDSPLRIFYVENEEHQIIAYDIFYRHVNDATYYIGWNSAEGRRKYLNNLLLYHAALRLKEEGVRNLDLGGIEYIYTESIAKFKDGMKPEHYRRMGEFIKI